MSDNQLTSIPSEIGSLKKLKELKLGEFHSVFRCGVHCIILWCQGFLVLDLAHIVFSSLFVRNSSIDNNDIGSIPQEVEQLCSSVNDSVVCEIGT